MTATPPARHTRRFAARAWPGGGVGVRTVAGCAPRPGRGTPRPRPPAARGPVRCCTRSPRRSAADGVGASTSDPATRDSVSVGLVVGLGDRVGDAAPVGDFQADADEVACAVRARPKRLAVERSPRLRAVVGRQLRAGWSPGSNAARGPGGSAGGVGPGRDHRRAPREHRPGSQRLLPRRRPAPPRPPIAEPAIAGPAIAGAPRPPPPGVSSFSSRSGPGRRAAAW